MSTFSRFFSLWNKAKNQPGWPYETHGDLVLEVTRGGTDSLRRLNDVELRRAERLLQDLLLDPALASAQRQRRKIIAILAGRGAVNQAGKPDMMRIKGWVIKYGYLHKDINAYTAQELPRLVTQAESIITSDLKAIRAHHG